MNDLFNDYQRFAYSEKGLTGAHLENYIEKSTPGLGLIEMPTMMTPNIVEERKMNVAILDVFSRLLKDFIIFLGTPVTDYTANVISSQMLFLQSVDPKREISLYINSPGGSVYAGLGIYDTMQFVTNPIPTLCTSLAASMGSCLLMAGEHGRRSSLKNSRIMVHTVSSGTQGRVTDMEIALNETIKVKDILYNLYCDHTGKSFAEIKELMEKGDRWLSAEEAKELNLIDEVLIGSKVIRTGKENV